MRKLLAIFFGFGIIVLCSLIVSLIPLTFIGDSVFNTAKKHNIEITSSNTWNLHILTAEATTNKLEFKYHFGGNFIDGRCDNFAYNLLNGEIYTEKIVINLRLKKNTDVMKLRNDIKDVLRKEQNGYVFSSKNVVINIYKSDEHNVWQLFQEMIFNDIELLHNDNKSKYSASLGIDKDRKMILSYDKRNIGSGKYETNGEISNDNISCYLYDTDASGNINCYVKNLFTLIADISDNNIDDEIAKWILDKRINLKASINHTDNETQIDGKMIINNDIGDFHFNLAKKLIDVKFDNLQIDKTANEAKNIDMNDEDDILKKNIMSGQKHKSSSLINQNEMLENINTLNRLFMILINLSKNNNLEIKLDVSKVSFGYVFLKNFIFNAKNENGDINLKEFSFNFGDSEFEGMRIKYVDGQIGNINTRGSSLKQLNEYLYGKYFNSNDEVHTYQFFGDMKLGLDYIKLSDVEMLIDGARILTYDFYKRFNFEHKNYIIDKKVTFQNVDFDKYFSLDVVYKKLYNLFNDYQNTEKQEAALWKMLFEKNITNKNANEHKTSIVLNNVLFAGTRVSNFVYTKNETNNNLEINIISDGDILSGTADLFIGKKQDKDGLFADMNFKKINIDKSLYIKNKIENAIGNSLSDILFSNKEYNIPSLLGLNGDAKLEIDNLIIGNNLNKDIKADISIRDGNVYIDNMSLSHNNTKIDANSIISLQSRPDVQLAIAGSGFDLDDLFQSPLNGYLSFQVSLRTGGFNPSKFISNLQGNGQYVVQNLQIPKFNLLSMSKQVISNGIQKNVDYRDIIGRNELAFPKGTGNLLFSGDSVKGDFSASRELVSGSCEFEYNFENKTIKTASGSFAVIMTRKPADKPFPIYIPYACSGLAKSPDCLVNFGQLNELVNE